MNLLNGWHTFRSSAILHAVLMGILGLFAVSYCDKPEFIEILYPPHLNSPIREEILCMGSYEFNWEARSDGIDFYEVYLDGNKILTTTETSTTLTFDPYKEHQAEHQWMVVAYNEYQRMASASYPFYLQVDPYLQSPDPCENESAWIYFNDTEFVENVYLETIPAIRSDDRYSISTPSLPAGSYTWHYVYRRNFCVLEFQHPMKILAPPNVPVNLISPEAAMSPMDSTLYWEAPNNQPYRYEIELFVRLDSTKLSVWGESKTTENQSISTGILSPDSTTVYSWRVRTLEGHCVSEWIEGEDFTVFKPIQPLHWKNITSASTPYLDTEPSSIYDVTEKRIIILSGDYTYSYRIEDPFNPSYTDLTQVVGFIPPYDIYTNKHIEGVLIHDPILNRIIAFSTQPSSDTYQLYLDGITNSTDDDFFRWKRLPTSELAPPPRGEHACVYLPESNSLITLGGNSLNVGTFYDGIWILDLSANPPEWTNHTTEGAAPEAFSSIEAVYFPQKQALFFYGGRGGPAENIYLFDTLWKLELDPLKWVKMNPKGTAPPALFEHTTVQIDSIRFLMTHGGIDSPTSIYQATNATYLYNIETDTWEDLTIDGNPTPRVGVDSIYDEQRGYLYVFGGQSKDGITNELWVLTGFRD